MPDLTDTLDLFDFTEMALLGLSALPSLPDMLDLSDRAHDLADKELDTLSTSSADILIFSSTVMLHLDWALGLLTSSAPSLILPLQLDLWLLVEVALGALASGTFGTSMLVRLDLLDCVDTAESLEPLLSSCISLPFSCLETGVAGLLESWSE